MNYEFRIFIKSRYSQWCSHKLVKSSVSNTLYSFFWEINTLYLNYTEMTKMWIWLCIFLTLHFLSDFVDVATTHGIYDCDFTYMLDTSFTMSRMFSRFFLKIFKYNCSRSREPQRHFSTDRIVKCFLCRFLRQNRAYKCVVGNGQK
jgi:hypothetical protein